MKLLLTRATQIATVATGLFVATINAEDTTTFPATDLTVGPSITRGPAAVQPVVQPTVGEQPFFKPLEFRGSAELRQTAGGKESLGKESVPSERHWKFLLGITVAADYDDNIFLAPNGSKEDDFIFAFAPTVGIQFGDVVAGSNYVLFTYTPTFVVFVDHSDQNSIEHALDFKFVRQTDIWKLSGNFDFQSLNGASSPLREASGAQIGGERIGERVDRQLYTAGLRYNYNLSDKTSLEFGISADGTHYLDFLDTVDLVSQNYFDFAITGKTSIGLGVGIGFAKTQGSANQIYEQPLARIRYYATSKLALEVRGGAEFRQIDGGGNQVNGVFGLLVTFSPSDRTTFSLEGYRNVNPSSFESNTDFTTTGVRLSATQQVHGKLTAGVSIGYENSEYHAITSDTVLTGRSDNYFYVRPSIQYQLGYNGAVELFYEYRKNDSTLAFDQFSNNRVGVKVGFAF